MIFKILLILSSVVLSTALTAKLTCMSNSECGQGECCFRHDGPMIVSKRQISLMPILGSSKGVCERYQLKGEHCGLLDKANGHCSCAHGLSCQFVPAKLLTLPPLKLETIPPFKIAKITSEQRRSIYMPGPGTFECMPIKTDSN